MGFQVTVLIAIVCLLLAWGRAWPYPSAAVRWLLPARQRWPEAQIREMLATDRLHPKYLHFFNRDPGRYPPAGHTLLSPADGRFLSAEVRGSIRYLVIALSFWDVHVQRSPLAGTVKVIESAGDVYRDGEGRDFVFLAAKQCPVQKRLRLDTAVGEIAIRLITSLSARRIEVWWNEGEALARGQRLGRILLGSTVVVEVPADWAVQAIVGQRVRAGESVLVDPGEPAISPS